jgi:hypothetical protein
MNEVSHGKQIEVLDVYPTDGLNAAQYQLASKIAMNWNKMASTIIETAKLLHQVEQLPFLEKKKVKAYLKEHAKISPSIMSRLVKIADNEVLTLEQNIPLLPPSYNTLYELAGKDKDVLRMKFVEGAITPNLERKDVVGLFDVDPKGQEQRDAEKQARNKTANPSIKLTFKGNFKNAPADKLQALYDACQVLKEFRVDVGFNEANKVD